MICGQKQAGSLSKSPANNGRQSEALFKKGKTGRGKAIRRVSKIAPVASLRRGHARASHHHSRDCACQE